MNAAIHPPRFGNLKDGSIEEFLTKFEAFTDLEFTAELGTGRSEALAEQLALRRKQYFLLILEGEALQVVKENEHQSYGELKALLLKEFAVDIEAIYDQIETRKQGYYEPIESYISAFKFFLKEAPSYPKRSLRGRFISGLQPALQNAVIRGYPETLEDAFRIARSAVFYQVGRTQSEVAGQNPPNPGPRPNQRQPSQSAAGPSRNLNHRPSNRAGTGSNDEVEQIRRQLEELTLRLSNLASDMNPPNLRMLNVVPPISPDSNEHEYNALAKQIKTLQAELEIFAQKRQAEQNIEKTQAKQRRYPGWTPDEIQAQGQKNEQSPNPNVEVPAEPKPKQTTRTTVSRRQPQTIFEQFCNQKVVTTLREACLLSTHLAQNVADETQEWLKASKENAAEFTENYFQTTEKASWPSTILRRSDNLKTELPINTVSQPKISPIFNANVHTGPPALCIQAKILDMPISDAVVDTGASHTVVSMRFVRKACATPYLEPVNLKYKSSSGDLHNLEGVIRDCMIEVQGIRIPLDVYVTNATCYDVLLGLDWLTQADARISIASGTLSLRKNQDEWITLTSHEAPAEALKRISLKFLQIVPVSPEMVAGKNLDKSDKVQEHWEEVTEGGYLSDEDEWEDCLSEADSLDSDGDSVYFEPGYDFELEPFWEDEWNHQELLVENIESMQVTIYENASEEAPEIEFECSSLPDEFHSQLKLPEMK